MRDQDGGRGRNVDESRHRESKKVCVQVVIKRAAHWGQKGDETSMLLILALKPNSNKSKLKPNGSSLRWVERFAFNVSNV